jgi:hypothetical protein
VFFDVLFVGFMPEVDAEFWLALESLLWPGAFPEFPGDVASGAGCAAGVAWELPFPARAEPVNAARTIASTTVPSTPVVRLVISFSPRIRRIYP